MKQDIFLRQTVQRQNEQDWRDLPRFSKLARTLYPGLVDASTRQAQAALSANEGKRPPQIGKLLKDSERGCVSPLGNLAKQTERK